MILESLFSIVLWLLDTIMFVKIPSIPDNVLGLIDEGMVYLKAGGGILANYTDLNYLLSLFGIIVTIDLIIMGYHLIMWIIKKAPIASE